MKHNLEQEARVRRLYHKCSSHEPGCPVHQHPEAPTGCTCPLYSHPLCIFAYCPSPKKCKVPGTGCLSQRDRKDAFAGIEDEYFANHGACTDETMTPEQHAAREVQPLSSEELASPNFWPEWMREHALEVANDLWALRSDTHLHGKVITTLRQGGELLDEFSLKIPQLLDTIDALTAENEALREARDRVLALLVEGAFSATVELRTATATGEIVTAAEVEVVSASELRACFDEPVKARAE